MRELARWRPGDGGRWWTPFLAGAAAGLLTGVLVRRRPEPGDGSSDVPSEAVDEGSPGGTSWERWRGAWGDAVEGAVDGLAGARELVLGRPPVDVEALEERLAGMACFADCRVRALGEGIVELVGTCGSEGEARTLLDAVAAQPGVEVVVNRVWTPESAG